MRLGNRKDFIGLFLILLSGWVLTYQIANRLDIVPTDDDVYFKNGLTATWQNLPPVQMAPLFSLWYRIIQFFTGDILQTYYVSWALLSILPGILFYVLLRSLRVGLFSSVWLAVFFLFCELNFPLQPKVSVFSMLWLMGGLIWANRSDKPVTKLMVTAGGALLAAYARPEFYLAFLLLTGVAVVYWLWQRRRNGTKTAFPRVGAYVAGAGLLLAVTLGSPMQSSRSHIAFGQHFAMNYAVWHPEIDASPWMHSSVFIKHGFGRDITSLGDAFFLNPALFMRHITTNVVNLGRLTANYSRDMLADPWLKLLEFPGRRYLLLALAVAFVALTNWRATFGRIGRGLLRDGAYWFCLGAVLLPTFISTILIFPREHYVIFHALLYISLAGVLLRDWVFRPLPVLSRPAVHWGLNALLLALFLVPLFRESSRPKPTPLVDNVLFFRSMGITQPVNLFSNEPMMYELYLTPDWHFFYQGQYKPTNLGPFLTQQKINMVHVRPDMAETYARDPYFVQLTQQPASLGYVKKPAPQPGQYVLIRQDLLPLIHSTNSD